MKNCDYWKSFIMTGRVDDYLNYIACTKETEMEDLGESGATDKEGDFSVGIDYNDGNGFVGHVSW
jgi:hypothetical protein